MARSITDSPNIYLTIGRVAAQTGVTPKAIRHYETLGLIPPVSRTGTYRQYQSKHVSAIQLIRRAQKLGFTLAELRDLGNEDCQPDWARFAAALEHKHQQLQARIQHLQEQQEDLMSLRAMMQHWINDSDSAEEITNLLTNRA